MSAIFPSRRETQRPPAPLCKFCRSTRIQVGVDAGDAHGPGWLDYFHQRVDDGFLHVLGTAVRPVAVALEADTIHRCANPTRAGAEKFFSLIGDRGSA